MIDLFLCALCAQREYALLGCDVYKAHQSVLQRRMMNMAAVRLKDASKLKLTPWPVTAMRLTRPHTGSMQVNYVVVVVISTAFYGV